MALVSYRTLSSSVPPGPSLLGTGEEGICGWLWRSLRDRGYPRRTYRSECRRRSCPPHRRKQYPTADCSPSASLASTANSRLRQPRSLPKITLFWRTLDTEVGKTLRPLERSNPCATLPLIRGTISHTEQRWNPLCQDRLTFACVFALCNCAGKNNRLIISSLSSKQQRSTAPAPLCIRAKPLFNHHDFNYLEKHAAQNHINSTPVPLYTRHPPASPPGTIPAS